MAGWKSTRLWMGSLLICTWAASAQADECEKNEDCPKGYTCEAYTSMGAACDSAPPCEPGATCPERDADCDAVVVEEHVCAPASCTSDADCGANMACFKQTITECSGGAAVPACPPDQPCPMPEPAEESCIDKTFAQCVPVYLLPCAQDNDCGEGFECVASEECMCSGEAPAADAGSAEPLPYMGSGGDQSDFAPVPPSDAGTDLPPEGKGDAAVGGGGVPNCECHPSELKHCEVKNKTCNTDQDCPSDFTCVTYSDAGSTCGVSPGQDASVCDQVETRPEEKRCEPRYRWSDPGRGGADGPLYDHDGEGQATGAPRDANSGTDGGIATDLPTTGEESATEPETTSSCSVATPRAGTLSALLAPLGLAFLTLGLRIRRKAKR